MFVTQCEYSVCSYLFIHLFIYFCRQCWGQAQEQADELLLSPVFFDMMVSWESYKTRHRNTREQYLLVTGSREEVSGCHPMISVRLGSGDWAVESQQ